MINAAILRAPAKIVAANSLTSPFTIGRLSVLRINRSDSTSITILKAFAAPAASVPPISVAIVIFSDGYLCAWSEA